MRTKNATAEAAEGWSFPFTGAEVQALQEVARQMAHLGNSLAESEEAARSFLEAAITADRETLMAHYGDGVKPSQVGPIGRVNSEMGVREASCQLRFNLGNRFRFFIGVEEQ